MNVTEKETCLVTGVAGFIGSHLAERLVDEGYRVIGVDCFTDYYAREIKEHNLSALRRAPTFDFVEAQLGEMDLDALLGAVSYVFHQAAQAGVRASWGQSFAAYTDLNILTTQKLLEAARQAKRLKKFVYASSSSVYGDSEDLPLRETSLLKPISPYGVSKLAGEHLARLYAKNFGVPTVSLRYFTVYGPRQRPDMAFHKFLRAIYAGDTIEIYGDGEQTRDFTFVSDAVQANVLAMDRGQAGSYFNIGGGSRVTLNHCLELLGRVTGRELHTLHVESKPGDVRHTWADTTAAEEVLGFQPRVSLEEGLERENAWFREVMLNK
ncbi:MAG: GDP-mannose 4,6-dehydratase [Chloroflexota bacterium]|nr:GDP-mannose 4,6-dehydratase [Chloroflexota bacterium]